jgi:TatA/E family protein of Tat protein translocase
MGTITAILIVILVVALLFRGPKNLPSIGGMLGRGVKATKEELDALRSGDPPPPPGPGQDPGSPGSPPPGP